MGNVVIGPGIPSFAVLLTPASEEVEPDHDGSGGQRQPRHDLEERRHS